MYNSFLYVQVAHACNVIYTDRYMIILSIEILILLLLLVVYNNYLNFFITYETVFIHL